MVLINPDEVHTGSKAHDAGWLYRGYYPEMEQIDGILDELEIHHGGVPRFADSVIHDQPLARAFVHLHRLLAEHAGSLETRPAGARRCSPCSVATPACQKRRRPGRSRWRWPVPANCWRRGCSIRLRWRNWRRRSICPRSILPGSSVAPPACRPTPGFRQRRLEQARALLKSGRAPLEVALELGFADQSHLGRQFKQAYGVAPGEYRSACARSSLTIYE